MTAIAEAGIPDRRRMAGWSLVQLFVVGGAILAAAAGIVLAIYMVANRAPAISFVELGEEASAGGMSLSVGVAEWVDPGEMNEQAQVFPMPASMMPGMPDTGQGRLHMEVSLRNPGAGVRAYSPDEFRLEAGSGIGWEPSQSSFLPGALGPHEALSGDIYFDVPQTNEGLYLVWTKGESQIYMPAANGAEVKPHLH